MKLNYKQTFLIGFGFFASSVAWAMYNTYVPKLLEQYLASTLLIGAVMTVDNIFGVIFQPLFGAISDKTQTRFGRRMPYILIGLPVCAAAFSLIPFTWSLPTLMGVVILFNFVMSTWRAPVVAFMPDITPSPLRSQANGIINFMGGVGSLISFFLGGILFKLGGMPLPFITSAAIMLLALVMLMLFVNEEKMRIQPEAAEETRKEEVSQEEKTSQKKSLLFLLFAILFWFTGYNAVETFFSLYVTNTLKDAGGQFLDAGDAAMLLAMYSLTFLICAIPAGILGTRIGRRKTILIGLAGVTIIFAGLLFTSNLWVLRILLLLGGAFWACVNINSLPMVVELAPWKDIGKFTGYYYFFSFSAAIISPILYGWIRDVVQNYQSLFIYSAAAFFIAILCMTFVKHGEARPIKQSASEILENLDS